MTTLTALVLEDSLTQANIITRLINARGWGVLHCLTTKEALTTLRSVSVQAVFIDVFVGEQNTIALLPEFRRAAVDAPMIVMTAGSSRESIEDTLRNARLAQADFVLRKPFSEAQLAEIIKNEGAGSYGRPKHVLVVDDSGPIRGLTRNMLESAGYRVSTADCMEDAFRNTDVAHVDLVLCDVFMPGMGGLKGMRHIKAVWPQVRIIAMSAGVDTYVSDAEALSAARGLGAEAQISKPFDRATLLEVADIVLQSPATQLTAA